MIKLMLKGSSAYALCNKIKTFTVSIKAFNPTSYIRQAALKENAVRVIDLFHEWVRYPTSYHPANLP